MAINTSKVAIGGLAAGITFIALDWVVNGVLMADRMSSELRAVSPALADNMMKPGTMVAYIISDLIMGVLVVWLYAAIRPRFGPGARTAVYTALFVWLMGGILYYGYVAMGLMTGATYALISAAWLVVLLVGCWVGAKLYTEGDAAPAGAMRV